MIVEKIVERFVKLEDRVGTAARLLKIENGRNVAKALKILHEEVDKQNVEALVYLGSIYHDGQLIPEDKIKAFRYYESAAQQGNAEAWY